MIRSIVRIALIPFLINLVAIVSQASVNPKAISNVRVEPGYFLHAAVVGLDFPTALAFHEHTFWVAEAGFVDPSPPAIKQFTDEEGSQPVTILTADMLPQGRLVGPLTDITWHEGWLWITHRQVGANDWFVGAVSKFRPEDPAGTFETVLTNLPAAGDHFVEEVAFAPSGRAYVAIGTATNSAVVGPDNWFLTQWLQMFPAFHDYAPVDLVLAATGFLPPVPFPLDPDGTALTAPYMPYGSGAVPAGTMIHAATPQNSRDGMIAGNGAVYSFDPTAADPTSTLQLEAWGFRNPYGIRIDPLRGDRLWVTNNGADDRSMEVDGKYRTIEPRPIFNDWEDLYSLETGGEVEFFGFPDYFNDPQTGAVLPVTDPLFCRQEEGQNAPCPGFILDESFRDQLHPLPAAAELEEHSSANKFDISTGQQFRFVGNLFVAETGGFVPVKGVQQLYGFRVVRVDPDSREEIPFIDHITRNPDIVFDPDGFNSPIDVEFDGDTMWVVDFGVFAPGIVPIESNTGKIWRVTHGNPSPLKERSEIAQAAPGGALFEARSSAADGPAGIVFDLPRTARVELSIFDVQGRRVARLVDATLGAGQHQVDWSPAGVPAGVYLARLTMDGATSVRRIVVTR